MKPVNPNERDAIELAGHLQAPRFHAQRSYFGIRAAALNPDSPIRALYAPLDWQCQALLTQFDGSIHSSTTQFGYIGDDHWRWFFLFCAEALYGDNYCPDLATEIETNPPLPGNRTHPDRLGLGTTVVAPVDNMDELAAYGRER